MVMLQEQGAGQGTSIRDQLESLSSCVSAVYQVTLQDLNSDRLSLWTCHSKTWCLPNHLKAR